MTANFSANDFLNGALSDLGRTFTHYAATTTHDNITDDETLSFATGVSRSGVFLRREAVFKLDQSGWAEQGDAFVMVANTITLAKNDELTIDSKRYRVDNTIKRYIGTTNMHNFSRLLLVGDA